MNWEVVVDYFQRSSETSSWEAKMLRSWINRFSRWRAKEVKKKVLFLSVFFLVCPLTISVSPASAVYRIMPLGDSITRGFTGSSDDTGYRRELYLLLAEADYSVNFIGSQIGGIPNDFDSDHEGHSGFHADGSPDGDGEDILDNVFDWLIDQQNLGNPADIVLLHIGTNDISVGGEDADEVDAILDEIDQYDQNTWVVLARIINRVNYSQATTDFNDSVATMVQNRINLQGDRLFLVDMENGAGIIYSDQPDGDMEDDIHPNDSGYAKMADVWFSAVQQVTQPVANAGPDQSVSEFDLVTLDGFNSSDPLGKNLSFQWEQTTGSTVVMSDPTSVQTTFTAPDVGPSGETLTFFLKVKNDENLESTDTVSVMVDNPNSSDGGGGRGGGGGCFIATVSYGFQLEPHVKAPRNFHDPFLLTNSVGKTFVNGYYTHSPPVAVIIAKHDSLGTLVRWNLFPLVGVSWLSMNIGLITTLALVTFSAILIALSIDGLKKKMRP
jgi:lysophospholipase L1-like esterase